jgi:hypothetical protein
MRKITLCLGVLIFAVLMTASAQSVDDDFGSMRDWTAGAGDWVVRGGRMIQQSPGAALARADRSVETAGQYELEFTIRYVDGGYDSEMDLDDGIYHAGFGIHIGVEDPALGRASWGAGDSYLLWLNLDTRETTRRNHPEHYGFRAQVYRSTSNTSMRLMQNAALMEDPELSRYIVDDYMSIDIIEALDAWGVDFSIEDIGRYLGQDVPINIRVEPSTGRVGVLDPTAPIRFYFNVDPDVLAGDHVSLRTNGLAASYDYFTME